MSHISEILYNSFSSSTQNDGDDVPAVGNLAALVGIQIIGKFGRYFVSNKIKNGLFWFVFAVQVITDRLLPRAAKLLSDMRRRRNKAATQVHPISEVTAGYADIEDPIQNIASEQQKGTAALLELERQENILKQTLEVITNLYSIGRNDHALCTLLSTISSAGLVMVLQETGCIPLEFLSQRGPLDDSEGPYLSYIDVACLSAIYFAGELFVEILFVTMERRQGIPIGKAPKLDISHLIGIVSLILSTSISFFTGVNGIWKWW
ncbi:hypothetical protein HDU97_002042 [Phlyctochytrium planicorne]|nr:hypothetical protein HDU97_002042 [Phlyctochytrium planicorne]